VTDAEFQPVLDAALAASPLVAGAPRCYSRPSGDRYRLTFSDADGSTLVEVLVDSDGENPEIVE